MEMGDCMEEMKMISNVGYEIGKKLNYMILKS